MAEFNSLEDAERAYNDLASEVEALRGLMTGVTMILTSVIAKHPNYDQFQLHLTSVVEISDNSKLAATLTPRQKALAREFVEQLQRIREVRGDIRPLGGSKLDGASP